MSSSIFTTGGLVLWSRNFNERTAPFDSLVKDVFIDSADIQNDQYEANGCTIKWLSDNANGLVFAVAYPRILTLSYIPAMLQTIKTLFLSLFGDVIECLVGLLSGKLSELDCSPSIRKRLFGGSGWSWPGWEATLFSVCKEMESERSNVATPRNEVNNAQHVFSDKIPNGTTKEEADADIIARNLSAFKSRQKSKTKKKLNDNAGSGSESFDKGSDTDSAAGTPKQKAKKELRKWQEGEASKEEAAALDFSSADSKVNGGKSSTKTSLVDKGSMGERDAQGIYSVADLVRQSISDDEDDTPQNSKTTSSGLFGRLTAALGYSTKSLTEEDLQPVIASIKEQLLSKNVAVKVAEAICKSVNSSLLGSTQATGFRSNSLKKAVKQAMNDALTRILTPKSSSDLLTDVRRKVGDAANKGEKDPYIMTFVGVNGVGKSTNLSKIAFWLLQNKLRVLIAACDTFRSGAVEQLKVHVNNLSGLSADSRIELYQKGYGKDAAGIAKDAITYAKQNDFQVVLIDTAGRMQDNEPLMRALAKVLFLSEAMFG